MGRNPVIPVPTPNTDRLAAQGVDSTHEKDPSPASSPSRSCLASGMEHEKCGGEVNRQSYKPVDTTFFRHLRDSGYHTMAVCKIEFHKGASGRTLGCRKNYSATIDMIASWLGIYQDRLRDRSDSNSTVVVYSSHRGEMLGDRGK